MSAIDADVFGLSEIENLPGTHAVQNLVDGLNAYVGDPGRYAAVADPATGTGTDAIKVAMIYKPAKVTPVVPAISDPDPVNNRPPLAQTLPAARQRRDRQRRRQPPQVQGLLPGRDGPRRRGQHRQR